MAAHFSIPARQLKRSLAERNNNRLMRLGDGNATSPSTAQPTVPTRGPITPLPICASTASPTAQPTLPPRGAPTPTNALQDQYGVGVRFHHGSKVQGLEHAEVLETLGADASPTSAPSAILAEHKTEEDHSLDLSTATPPTTAPTLPPTTPPTVPPTPPHSGIPTPQPRGPDAASPSQKVSKLNEWTEKDQVHDMLSEKGRITARQVNSFGYLADRDCRNDSSEGNSKCSKRLSLGSPPKQRSKESDISSECQKLKIGKNSFVQQQRKVGPALGRNVGPVVGLCVGPEVSAGVGPVVGPTVSPGDGPDVGHGVSPGMGPGVGDGPGDDPPGVGQGPSLVQGVDPMNTSTSLPSQPDNPREENQRSITAARNSITTTAAAKVPHLRTSASLTSRQPLIPRDQNRPSERRGDRLKRLKTRGAIRKLKKAPGADGATRPGNPPIIQPKIPSVASLTTGARDVGDFQPEIPIAEDETQPDNPRD